MMCSNMYRYTCRSLCVMWTLFNFRMISFCALICQPPCFNLLPSRPFDCIIFPASVSLTTYMYSIVFCCFYRHKMPNRFCRSALRIHGNFCHRSQGNLTIHELNTDIHPRMYEFHAHFSSALWIYNIQVISLFARHFRTGEPLPMEAIQNFCKASNMYAAIVSRSKLNTCTYC